jgi:hydrogenase nickel incorporation protein HypB
MCANCGCQANQTTLLDLQTGETTVLGETDQHDKAFAHSHEHDRGGVHSNADYPHDHIVTHRHSSDEPLHSHHTHGHASVSTIEVNARILAKNDALAAKTRAWFAGREILALNLVSSPGAGKTTVLERTIRELGGKLPLYVIEGDQATAVDGERIRAAGAAVVQVNTGTGCHLDAEMVSRAVAKLRPASGALVLIENVGNLVCPALFDLGERAKAVIFSVADGEDKPLKYPHMFSAAGIVILNKIDLLPHLDFSVEKAIEHLRRINNEAIVLQLSARTGEGMGAWCDWLLSEAAAARQATFA